MSTIVDIFAREFWIPAEILLLRLMFCCSQALWAGSRTFRRFDRRS